MSFFVCGGPGTVLLVITVTSSKGTYNSNAYFYWDSQEATPAEIVIKMLSGSRC